MVFKCILFLNHFLSLIPSPSYLPFPGTWDLFQVVTMMDPHSRTTWEELLNTREITKAVMRLTANIRGCLSGLCEKSFTFLGALSRGRDPCSPKTFHRGSLSSESLRGKPAAVAGGKCPHQGVVSSMAPGSSRDSPRSLIPASWRPRMDRPTSSSPLTESTKVSTPADCLAPYLEVLWTPKVYKWHVCFSGESLWDFRFWSGFVTSLWYGHPQELCKGEATGLS